MTAIPDDDLVELDVADRGRSGLGDRFDMLQHHQLESLGSSTTSVDDLLEALTFLSQDFEATAGLGVELGKDRVGLASGENTPLFSVGFCRHDRHGFLCLCDGLKLGACLGLALGALGFGGLGLGDVLRFSHSCIRLTSTGLTHLEGFGFLDL